MKIQGFEIIEPGDPSVGIFPLQWHLTGDFDFENEDELTDFKGRLANMFEFLAGEKVYVSTHEELDAQFKLMEV